MEKCIILRYGELMLRRANRRKYEDILEGNVRKVLVEHGVKAAIKRFKGRMVLMTDVDCEFLQRVFGIVSVSKTMRVGHNIKEINEALVKMDAGTAQIKFADKVKEDTELVEGLIYKGKSKVFVDIYPDHVFVYSSKEKAVEGLPVGSEGSVAVVVKKDEDMLAALLFMKRGCFVKIILQSKVDEELLKQYGCEVVKNVGKEDIMVDERSALYPLVGMSSDERKETLDKFKMFLDQ